MSHVPSNTVADEANHKEYVKKGGKKKQDYINMQANPGLTQADANAKVAKENSEVKAAAAIKAAAEAKAASEAADKIAAEAAETAEEAEKAIKKAAA